MKGVRPGRWSGQLSRPRIHWSWSSCSRYLYHQPQNHERHSTQRRFQSSPGGLRTPQTPIEPVGRPLEQFPSPPPEAAFSSAKLAALHARLSLSPQLPLPTLARCLVDQTADPNPSFNNASLATFGSHILSYHTAEHLVCSYPRLPMAVLFAAQWAFCGPSTLNALREEWGVERAAEPGGEVDPGLLQFKHLPPGTPLPVTLDASGRPDKSSTWRRGMSSRIVYDDAFGDVDAHLPTPTWPRPDWTSRGIIDEDGKTSATSNPGTSLQLASKNFVHAVAGAVYLHSGRLAAKTFWKAHIESRKLDLATLFVFKTPTYDLSRLCAREGFEPPVARLMSETGRKSIHPVFVVGVYSGNDLLGEAAGASLDEARFRAAAAALRGWYLYSPEDKGRVPSDTEGRAENESKRWEPVHLDPGEIIA